MAARLSRGGLEAGARVAVSAGGAERWVPPDWPVPDHPERIAATLGLLRDLGSSAGGVAAHLDPECRPEALDPEGRAAAAPIDGARRWLRAALVDPAEAARGTGWASDLCGLGRGLTPAGDDFLGGAMIALDALGRGALGRELWSRLRPLAASRTNGISRAFLAAAAEGLASASVREAVAITLRGDAAALRAIAPAISRIGHSSGWDAMAGAATVIGCRLELRKPGEA
jgi:hypothetical protein